MFVCKFGTELWLAVFLNEPKCTHDDIHAGTTASTPHPLPSKENSLELFFGKQQIYKTRSLLKLLLCACAA